MYYIILCILMDVFLIYISNMPFRFGEKKECINFSTIFIFTNILLKKFELRELFFFLSGVQNTCL